MKYRYNILWPSLAAIALVVVIAWFAERSAKVSKQTTVVSAAAENTAPSNTNSGAKSNSVRIIGPIERSTRLSKDLEMQEGLSTENDVPIVFYGKLEDQFSNVLANTTVNFGVRIYNGTEATVKRGQVVSDANGLFTISGYKGESLGIGVKKEGYVFVSMNGSSIYSKLYPENQRAHPDPNSPIIIKMWKLQGAEPLVNINQHYKLRADADNPIYFDLLAGKIVSAGGDVKIAVNRPTGNISQQHPQNWSIRLEILQGGFIITSAGESRVAFSAPVDGYVATGDFTNNNGPDLVDQMLFFKSRGGQVYGKLHFIFRINNRPNDSVSVVFNGVASTNGSRNWEATVPQ